MIAVHTLKADVQQMAPEMPLTAACVCRNHWIFFTD